MFIAISEELIGYYDQMIVIDACRCDNKSLIKNRELPWSSEEYL